MSYYIISCENTYARLEEILKGPSWRWREEDESEFKKRRWLMVEKFSNKTSSSRAFFTWKPSTGKRRKYFDVYFSLLFSVFFPEYVDEGGGFGWWE